MSSNFDYMPLMSGSRAYIRVDGVETGSFHTNGKTTLVARVGPRANFMNHTAEFSEKNCPKKTWEFKYSDASRSSFVVVISKKHLFGGDEEIGEVELRLSAFEPNTVVSAEFNLKSPHNQAVPARARLSVHLSEDGSSAFCAPAGGVVFQNAEIPHKKTYFQ
ncbi:hypothetical protein TVAG_001700 [Trichomonas vaginalis G3]|uniref:Uncharacterized protein n=1 Tax=Trichomonas vaginalis (strain ATCC PRA-98 / G3) TaxID=412133 RepID=A2FSX8_TRIV3|nr:C2 domain (calcium/lipid-binding domain, CaLB) family [Trichomonas vaginalis G3]EAX92000.1 hypothetical protein TVAG_001700 [Trichomonas vaginalis G3]KAI5528955.1 C2 domain (calcium/lipid-binding domain, CaLB) family [Trichomonas vaginalis G3]|eukprot:XP_001304930.1 hypothetical protein [Trichomonas vaginalis G3]